MGGLLRERICPTFRKNPRHSLTKARVGDLLCLQHSCKRQNGEKRPCRSPANAKMGKSALAEVLQTPKWGKAPLQESCKHQNGKKRPCRSPANAKMRKSVLAEVLQSPENSSKCLRESRKHLHLFSMRNGNALLAPFMQKNRRALVSLPAL